MQTYPRDFLGRVGVTSSGEGAAELAGADPGEVELSLGLSLGGCSAVGPKEKRKELQSLKRKRIENKNPRFAVGDRKDESFVGGEDSTRGFPDFFSNSQGSSSSGVSNLQGGFDIQRSIGCTKVKSQPKSAAGNHIMDPSKEDGALKRISERAKMRIMMESMPSVSTSQNGRTIEGFLYKYKKEEVEEARIVCVCHGSFLTPAEFVKHAGGGDVAHPLRHIFVNPAPLSLLRD